MAFKILLSSNVFARYFWDLYSTIFLICLYKGGSWCLPFQIVSSDGFLECWSSKTNRCFCYAARSGAEVGGDTSTFEKTIYLADSPAHIGQVWEIMFSALHTSSKASLHTGLERFSWKADSSTVLEQWRKNPAILSASREQQIMDNIHVSKCFKKMFSNCFSKLGELDYPHSHLYFS